MEIKTVRAPQNGATVEDVGREMDPQARARMWALANGEPVAAGDADADIDAEMEKLLDEDD